MLNLTTTLMSDAASVGAPEDMYKNANNLVSVANSPSGAAGLSSEKNMELVGDLVANMDEAAATMETSEETIELMMGSMGSVANGQLERLDTAAQTALFANSLGLLTSSATPGSRLAMSEASSTSACTTLATLLESEDLFGPSNSNSTNNSKAIGAALDNMASGKLVGRFAGMGATATSCGGLLLSAQKLSAEDTDGAPIAAGNSSFVMPANFSKMANISIGDTVETSAQVVTANPHRGASSAAINTDTTSLSMMVTSADRSDGGTTPLPVHNLTNPISIRIPLHTLGSVESLSSSSSGDDGGSSGGGSANMTLNVSCPGDKRLRAYHSCPGGAFINYTCDLSATAYEVRLKCATGVAHQCVFWDDSSLKWSSEGCRQVGVVATGGDSGFVICNCTHLTDFASQLDETLDLASDIITSVASLSLADLLKNILVLIVLLVVWGSIVVACLYSRYLDGLDHKKVVPFGQLPDDGDEDGKPGEGRDGNGGSGSSPNKGAQHAMGVTDDEAVQVIVRFLATGDGSDYGQLPDSLTPQALTRRVNKHVLKWRVYKEQTDGAIEASKRRLSLRNRAKVAPMPMDNAAALGSGADSEAKRKARGGNNKVVPLTDVPPVNNKGRQPLSPGGGTNKWNKVRHKVITVGTLKAVLNKEFSKSDLRGKILLDWWQFMKTQHKFLSVIFNKDTVYSRPERIMVIGVFFLFTMALNSFLFIFQGNANSGEDGWEIFVNQTTYILIMSVCQTPIMFLITLLFKRTAPTRPELEDRWVGAPRDDIPKKVRKSVELREEVMRAERQVRKAKEGIRDDRRMLRKELEEKLRLAVAEGRAALTDDEAASIVLLTERVEAAGKVRLAQGKARLVDATTAMGAMRQAQVAWQDARIVDLLGDPSFETPTGWNRIEVWVKCLPFGAGKALNFKLVKWRAQRTALWELDCMYLSREERAIAKAEREQMAKFGESWYGWLQQWAYKKYLNPLRDMKKLLSEELYLPGTLVYLVHGFVVLLALFCSYYTFLFSVMLNSCAKCGPAGSVDDDDVETCNACPDSMRDNSDPGKDIAVDWVITLLYTLMFNVFIMEPLKVGTKQALYPVFVNTWLAVKWDKYLLAADKAREFEEDLSDDDDIDIFAIPSGFGGGGDDDEEASSLYAQQQKAAANARKNKAKKGKAANKTQLLLRNANSDVESGSMAAQLEMKQDDDARETKRDVSSDEEAKQERRAEDQEMGTMVQAWPNQTASGAAAGPEGEVGVESTPVRRVSATSVSPAASGASSPADSTLTNSKRKKKKGKKSKKGRDDSRSPSRTRSQKRRQSGESASSEATGGGSDGGGGAAKPAVVVDPNPMWACACGHSCRELSRRDHLGDCKLFQRSWRAAFHVLTKNLFEQRQAQQQKLLEEGDGGGGGAAGASGGSKALLTVEQRLAALERAVAHFHAKAQAADTFDSGSSSSTGGAAEAAFSEEEAQLARLSPSARAAKTRWWTRGMLLASLVESGGDGRKAAAKLCRGASRKSAGENKAAAEMYRFEMKFVADKVGLEALLAEHNAQRQLAEL
jgi:hypothetical protein